jgi:hypothetical protein
LGKDHDAGLRFLPVSSRQAAALLLPHDRGGNSRSSPNRHNECSLCENDKELALPQSGPCWPDNGFWDWLGAEMWCFM